MRTGYTTKEIYLTQGQVEKLSTAVAKSRSVSLTITPETKSNKTAIKLMLTQQQINKLSRGKPFVLKLSAAQITAMAKHGGFLGPAFAKIARTILPKLIPVLGMLGLAATSGAVSGATKIAVSGERIAGDGIKQIATDSVTAL